MVKAESIITFLSIMVPGTVYNLAIQAKLQEKYPYILVTWLPPWLLPLVGGLLAGATVEKGLKKLGR
jgi:hypothetical protein